MLQHSMVEINKKWKQIYLLCELFKDVVSAVVNIQGYWENQIFAFILDQTIWDDRLAVKDGQQEEKEERWHILEWVLAKESEWKLLKAQSVWETSPKLAAQKFGWWIFKFDEWQIRISE